MDSPIELKPELLMPAGDLEKLKTAFQFGADAVYAGVPVFSLRTRENLFKIDEVKVAVEYAHSLGKKIYLTVNIFPHNYKIPALLKALKPLAELKPDAFIVADPGVIMFCREMVPEIPLHLSVQANNVNWASARFWHKQGISRIILSREISLNEVKEIHEKNPGLELEFFVHGSICMAYSGRCLLSNYLTYRDANQGTCAHICRWKYNFYLEEENRPGEYFKMEEDENGAYIMNSRDMCLAEYLKNLKDAGVCSFKVEGRNKTIFYVANAAKAYRQAIDDLEAGRPFNRDILQQLGRTSNRGFITGFLINNPREKAQDYEKTISHQTHEFTGVVRSVKNEGADEIIGEVEVKGRIDLPAELELLAPGFERKFKVTEMKTSDGTMITTAHPGQKGHILLKLPAGTCPGSILMKRK